ncbi:MAG: tRNA (guanosine(46)-N7)-methyltransferase TrmB [Lachnospiraceae bacterium]|nr:tRNA (guanosine(46)-N7)-methyltransferase TrmB [Lachnospiraceae bacterium]
MRLKNVKGSREYIAANDLVVHEEKEFRGKWKKEIFGNDNPLYIEIGMGKGQFITTLARLHPEINYVGIEKYSSTLIRGVQKVEADPVEAGNIRFIRMDAEEILDVFGEEEVDRIYLNFSDPWPKDRHAKRRLENKLFLAKYHKILKDNGIIEFKTDNVALFDFAVEELEGEPWKVLGITRDLHKDPVMCEGNVMTEYEEKFSAIGNPIYKYVIEKSK